MASQSITNKLVANIRQANDVSTNFFTGTNVVCIDTSNRRIGIDTKTPTWSIDISGVKPYNGVKCHNLDISGTAHIETINENGDTWTISGEGEGIFYNPYAEANMEGRIEFTNLKVEKDTANTPYSDYGGH